MESIFQQHLDELKTMGWIGPKHIDVAERMDKAVNELFIDEVEHYLEKKLNSEGQINVLRKYGLLGIDIPEKYSGLGGDSIALALGLERLGQLGMGPVTFVDVQCSLTGKTILEWGTEEQKKEYLIPAVRGEKILAFCLTEPWAGSEPTALTSEYKESEGGYELNGTKYLVSNGSIADAYIVFAHPVNKQNNMSAFLVDRDEEHIKVSMNLKEKLGMFTSDTALIDIEGAFVPQKNLIGGLGKGLPIAYSSLQNGRIGIAAGCLGAIEDCLNESIERAKTRIQHGKPIGKHQLIQRHISRIAEDLEMAKWPVYVAAYWKSLYDERINRDADFRKILDQKISLAKKVASSAAYRAADHALQIFGGFGYSTLCSPGRHYLDVRASRIYEGTDEIMELKIAAHLLGDNFEAFS